MATGYVLVMGYLALGLLLLRRRPPVRWEPARRFAGASPRRGWAAWARQLVGTALGGYVTLMVVVVAYYQGVAHVGGRFLMSAFTGTALLAGVALPLFFLATWCSVRRR